MYPLGILFGLGFDTATEIGLLAIAAGVATHHVPFLAIISLPLIFAAGMSLMDTADGAFMSQAYGWAFSNPIRKVYYNITVTSLSVAVALIIGSIELLQVLAARFSLEGGFWAFLDNLNFGNIGYVVVGLFVATWAFSVILWKTTPYRGPLGLARGAQLMRGPSRPLATIGSAADQAALADLGRVSRSADGDDTSRSRRSRRRCGKAGSPLASGDDLSHARPPGRRRAPRPHQPRSDRSTYEIARGSSPPPRLRALRQGGARPSPGSAVSFARIEATSGFDLADANSEPPRTLLRLPPPMMNG